jgi:hypothetical protein
MDEEWDNLIILDACRYDLFESVSDFDGQLESRRSSGSATAEFLANNFDEGQYHDTVYVSANPHVVDIDTGRFHRVVDVWRDGWDDEHGTVLPEEMTRRCLECHESYPRKRLICHYVQPHHPFLGPTAETEFPELQGNAHAREEAMNGDSDERDHVWQRVADGEIDIGTVERAYRETLEITLPHVSELASALPGLTVVTSDHGNLLDEPAYDVLSVGTRRHDHPIHATAEPLTKVPWLVLPTDRRKSISAEPPVDEEPESVDKDVVSDRLDALGYK